MDRDYKIVTVYKDGDVQESGGCKKVSMQMFSNSCADKHAVFVIMFEDKLDGTGYHLYQSWTK